MKTQSTKLVFKKNAISELNTKQLNQIQGGTGSGITPALPTIIGLTPKIKNGGQGEDMQTGQQ